MIKTYLVLSLLWPGYGQIQLLCQFVTQSRCSVYPQGISHLLPPNSFDFVPLIHPSHRLHFCYAQGKQTDERVRFVVSLQSTSNERDLFLDPISRK